jgi:N-ethylmaleimide reductase
MFVCQFWHCGRLSLLEFHDGQPPMAPSAVNPE